MYGYYSPKADLEFGHKIYKNGKNEEVKVTAIYKSKEYAENNYLWEDKYCIGEVTEFVRSIKRR